MGTSRPVKRDKNHIEGLRGGVYARVSSAKDKDNRADKSEARTDKSTEDQAADGRGIFARRGLVIGGTYSDPDISASRFAVKKFRPGFERMLDDIRGGELDLIWFWELSRSQRRLGVFADLRDLCRDRGVLWMVGETVYDPTSYEDMMLLGVLSIVAEGESEIKSKNVTRGLGSNAARGLPYGPVIYGYKRHYTPGAPGRRLFEALDHQGPDGLLDGVTLTDGKPPADSQLAVDSPARIVREIFRRYAYGTPERALWGLNLLAGDLNGRGIPTARGADDGRSSGSPRWRGSRIRDLLTNPAYGGLRLHQGEILQLEEGSNAVPPLVDAETYWAVQDRFAENGRQGHRISIKPSSHLLATVARCEPCGETLKRWKDRRGHGHYACMEHGCRRVSVLQTDLDQYVEDKLILWGSSPATLAAISASSDDSAAAAAARADLFRYSAELEETRQLFEDGEMSPVMASRKEKKLLGQIKDAGQRSREATMPKIVADNIGPEFARTWVNDMDIPAKREFLRAVADIRVRAVGRGNYLDRGNARRPVAARVAWQWLMGQGRGELPEPAPVYQTKRERARAILLENPDLCHSALATRLGISAASVTASCRSLIADSTIGECRHRLTEDGRQTSGRPPKPKAAGS